MSAGFYKYEDQNLYFGANYVLNADYELRKEIKDNHSYPVDGWYWFDSQEEAKQFFEIEEENNGN